MDMRSSPEMRVRIEVRDTTMTVKSDTAESLHWEFRQMPTIVTASDAEKPSKCTFEHAAQQVVLFMRHQRDNWIPASRICMHLRLAGGVAYDSSAVIALCDRTRYRDMSEPVFDVFERDAPDECLIKLVCLPPETVRVASPSRRRGGKSCKANPTKRGPVPKSHFAEVRETVAAKAAGNAETAAPTSSAPCAASGPTVAAPVFSTSAASAPDTVVSSIAAEAPTSSAPCAASGPTVAAPVFSTSAASAPDTVVSSIVAEAPTSSAPCAASGPTVAAPVFSSAASAPETVVSSIVAEAVPGTSLAPCPRPGEGSAQQSVPQCNPVAPAIEMVPTTSLRPTVAKPTPPWRAGSFRELAPLPKPILREPRVVAPLHTPRVVPPLHTPCVVPPPRAESSPRVVPPQFMGTTPELMSKRWAVQVPPPPQPPPKRVKWNPPPQPTK